MLSQVRVAHVVKFSLAGDSRTQGEIDWPGPGKSVYDCNYEEHNNNMIERERTSKSGSTVFAFFFDSGLCLDGIEAGLENEEDGPVGGKPRLGPLGIEPYDGVAFGGGIG